MKNWFNEAKRSFVSGTEKAYGVPELQRDLTMLSDRVADAVIDDNLMTQEILEFLTKHPEQTKDHNFQVSLGRWMDVRPGMKNKLAEILGMK